MEPISTLFISTRFPNMTVVLKRGDQHTVWDPEQGRQTLYASPDHVIKFRHGQFRTSNPKEIEMLRNHPAFTGYNTQTGRPERITIEEIKPRSQEEQQVMQAIQQYGHKGIMQLIRGGQYQQQQAAPQQQHQHIPVQQDPAAATQQYYQQQVQR